MSAHAREIQSRAGAMGQLPGTRDEVSMNMGLGHVRNSESLVVRRLNIGIDVAVRIDDERLTAGRTADEVTGLGELGVVEALQKHGQESGVRSRDSTAWRHSNIPTIIRCS